jgi:hypothetical protein
LLLLAVVAAAEDRLAVLEFFGRPTGQYCRDGGPAMIALQQSMAGRAVLLEYHYDYFPTGRIDRFWAAQPNATYLPLVMVGSGYRTSTGQVDYQPAYQAMLNAELARLPQAEVTAFSRRVGSALRLYVRAVNRRTAALTPADSPAIWAIAWENGRIGVSDTWVRAAARYALTAALEPGAAVTAVVNTSSFSPVDWNQVTSLVLLEHRPGGVGKYDMLQATIARPAALTVTPGELALGPDSPSAQVALDGPHVLAWTATADVPWLQVTPSGSGLPATATVSLVSAALPAAGGTGTVRFDASGDGLEFSASVTVTAPGQARPIRRRLRSVPPAAGAGR